MSGTTLLQKWQLLQQVLADRDLLATEKLVMARLLYHHSAQTGRCSPSYQTLADGVGLKRRAIINAIHHLEERGWLSVARVKGGDPTAARGFVTNTFQINFGRLPEPDPSASECTPPSAFSDTSGVHGDALPPQCTVMHPTQGKIQGKETGKSLPLPPHGSTSGGKPTHGRSGRTTPGACSCATSATGRRPPTR